MTVLLSALILALAPQSGELDLLDHKDPRVRLNTIENAGLAKLTQYIGRLITVLEDPIETSDIKAKTQESLELLTGRAEKDPAAWRKWWDDEGSARFPEAAAGGETLTAKDKEALVKAKQDIRAITTVLAVAIFLFIIVMFFFVGHVSSKIKGWRELVARAEIYVKHGQELTERTDKIAAEIESRKAELGAYVEKVRKEQEEEIARRGDELGSRLEHELRMELQNLRQKAERELDQTVTDLKTQIETTARRAASEVRDRLAK